MELAIPEKNKSSIGVIMFPNRYLRLIVLLFSLLTSSQVFSGNTNGTWGDPHSGCPNQNCPKPSDAPPMGGDSSTGNPLHSGTGNKWQYEPVYKGVGESPIAFAWYYNSRMRPVTDSPVEAHGLWTHTYGIKITETTLGSVDHVFVHFRDGKTIDFKDISGSYNLADINKSPALFGRLDTESSGTVYVYTSQDRLEYRFNQSDGLLTSITWPNSVVHTLDRNVVSSKMNVTVSDTYGNNFVLEFSGTTDDGYPAKLTDAESNVYDFAYSDYGDPAKKMLTSITFPDYATTDDSKRTFIYLEDTTDSKSAYITDHPTAPASNWNFETALVAIEDAADLDSDGYDDVIATWKYNSSGQAVYSSHGEGSDETDIFELTPAEGGSWGVGDAHKGFITDALGCETYNEYHSYIDYTKTMPWLDIKAGKSPGTCSFLGTFEDNDDTWQNGGLWEGGYKHSTKGIIKEYRVWDASTPHQVDTAKWEARDRVGTNHNVFKREEYTWHSSYPLLTKVEKSIDESGTVYWQNIEYDYFDGTGGEDDNGRIETISIEDTKNTDDVAMGSDNLSLDDDDIVPYTTTRTRTWSYAYTYHDTSTKEQVKTKAITDPRSKVTTYTYDTVIDSVQRGFLSKITDEGNNDTTFTYNKLGHLKSVTDPNDIITRYEYTDRGWLEFVCYEAASTTASCTSSNDDMHYEYYTNGLIKKVTQPDGSYLEYTYSTAGKLIKLENKEGEEILITTAIDRNGDSDTSDSEDSTYGSGSTISATNNFGTSNSKARKAVLTEVKNSSGTVKRSRKDIYDVLDRLIYASRGTGADETSITYTYGENKIPRKVTAITEENGASNVITRKTYNVEGWLEYTCYDAASTTATCDSTNYDIYYEYEDQGNIKQVTYSNGSTGGSQNVVITRYFYDGFNQLVREDSVDRGTIVYEHDAAGNVEYIYYYDCSGGSGSGGFHNDVDSCTLTQKDKYVYDDLNRLDSIDYKNDATTDIDYIYDHEDADHGEGLLRLTRVTDDGGTTNYKYDAYGRITKSTFTPDGTVLNLATEYTYTADGLGDIKKVKYHSGSEATYTRTDGLLDDLKFLDNSVTYTLVDNVVYQPFGGIEDFDNPLPGSKTLEHLRTYDSQGRITQHNFDLNDDGGFDVDYSYDAFDNITSINDEYGGSEADQSFTYDTLQRLTQATGLYGKYTYTYDDVGNRLSRKLERYDPDDPTKTYSEVYTEKYYYDDGTTGGSNDPDTSAFDNNRLLKVKREEPPTPTLIRERTFTYDDRGNVTRDERKKDMDATTITTTVEPEYGDHNRMKGTEACDDDASTSLDATCSD